MKKRGMDTYRVAEQQNLSLQQMHGTILIQEAEAFPSLVKALASLCH